jgi:hypothetical protein
MGGKGRGREGGQRRGRGGEGREGRMGKGRSQPPVKVSIICERGQTSFRCMYGLRWDEVAAASASDSQSGLSKGRGRLEHAC